MANKASVALLLEDEPLISLDIELALESAGFDVTTIMSCQEAIEWLGMFRPDIAIVDIVLRDGLSDEVVNKLVEDYIPFMVHSGDHPNMHIGTPFEHGRWVCKPAAANELVDAARALLSA